MNHKEQRPNDIGIAFYLFKICI
ncbi:protein of unknown function [Azospirillum baldaniorum]|uniref:Uncharacterized protein n=1 Tax=Azospirillum baldaniorum TaxID=1064539 RepID=A0A9P1JNN8_9PROT|nr:protein of unknown function [Azospirillum baldaniorum]